MLSLTQVTTDVPASYIWTSSSSSSSSCGLSLLEPGSHDSRSESISVLCEVSSVCSSHAQLVYDILHPSSSRPSSPSTWYQALQNDFLHQSCRFICPKYFIFLVFIFFSNQFSWTLICYKKVIFVLFSVQAIISILL